MPLQEVEDTRGHYITTTEAYKTSIQALVISRLRYGSALLCGITPTPVGRL